MKKIFEFKVFDILQDKENVKFLDKVKKENPDLYTKFLNLIGNKGLDFAKDKYQEYEPEYVKQKIEKEKKISDAEKKKIKKEKQEFEKQEVLKKYKDVIDEIESAMFSFDLYEIESEISKDKNIQNYIKSCSTRKSRENKFNQTLKKSASVLEYELNNRYLSLEIVKYKTNFTYSYYHNNINIIFLEYFYNIKQKKLEFTVSFNLFDEPILSMEKNKEEEFLFDRNRYIIKELNKFRVSKEEVIDSIKNLSYTLSDEYYNDWKIKNDADKYNI